MYTKAQKANAFVVYARTAPSTWKYSNGTLRDDFEDAICAIVDSEYGGDYTQFNLHQASLRLIQKREEQKQAQSRFQRQLADTMAVVNANPTLIRGDHANDVVTGWWAQHPEGTAAELEAYLKTKSDDPHPWADAKPIDFVAMVKSVKGKSVAEVEAGIAELARVYGQDRIDKAREDLAKSMRSNQFTGLWHGQIAAEKAADAAAATSKRENDSQEIKKVREHAEALTHLRISNNHAENRRAEKECAAIAIYKDGGQEIDWFKTNAARQAYVDRITSSSVR